MSTPITIIFCALTLLLQLTPSSSFSSEPQMENTSTIPFEAFTGKIIKNKVRLRQQPSLESPIVRELKQGDLILALGETDDFYAVQPPADVKGFVFRTYILDNIVEANRVNVRIAADVDAPIIGQLSAGEHVIGTISTSNNKWLEIVPPASTRFYVAKEYIQKIGDVSKLAIIEKRREEVNLLLNSTHLASQEEMQKPFPDTNLDPILASYNKIINSYPDFPEQVARAQDQLKALQSDYLHKKLTFLETKTKLAQNDWQNKNIELNEQVKTQQQQLKNLEQKLNKNRFKNAEDAPTTYGAMNKMSIWQPIEKDVFNNWQKQHPEANEENFYQSQRDEAIVLSGIVEPYTRVIKNKPGDYFIVNPMNNLPIAFIYSTQVNLQDKVGQNVTLYGALRSNNNFAYPAYFILSE